MEPDKALELLDRICSQVSLNRETHVQVQQAVVILRQALSPKECPDKEE